MSKPGLNFAALVWYAIAAFLIVVWGSVCLGIDWLFPDLFPGIGRIVKRVFGIE